MYKLARLTDASTRPERSIAFAAAGWAAVASGVLGVAMVATLIAMFVGFALGPNARSTALRLGLVNDVLTTVVYGLALPVVPVMHVVVRETGNVRSLVLATLGAVGIVVTLVLQWLLVSGAMTFEQQIGSVSVALLAVAAWMVGTGYLAWNVGFLPHGVRDGLLGGLYIGYPIWAFTIGRRLLHGRSSRGRWR